MACAIPNNLPETFDDYMARVETIAWEIATAHDANRIDERRLVESILRRSSRYNALERGRLTDSTRVRYSHSTDAHKFAVSDPYDLWARLLFFTIADLGKLRFPLIELLQHATFFDGERPFHVLDVGAGCGTQSLALFGMLPFLPQARLHITAIDHHSGALSLMTELVNKLCLASNVSPDRVTLETHVANFTTNATYAHRFDLVLIGNALVEIEAQNHIRIVKTLLDALNDRGALVIVEPALRHTARDLHRLRNQLVAGKLAHVFAPCTHQAPCPALDDERDWCHEQRAWNPPPRFAKLAHEADLRRSDMKWTYLTLTKQPINVSAHMRLGSASNHPVWRVVSEPLRSKGKLEFFLCGPRRQRVVRLDRHRTERNAPYDTLDRGSLCVIDEEIPSKPIAPLRSETNVIASDPGRVDLSPRKLS